MKKIFLLIDDDPIANLINNRFMKRSLPNAEIHSFNSAYQALLFLHQLDSWKDLQITIFLDINMPVMNGWDFLNELNKEFVDLNIAIHMLSSSVDKVDQEKSQSYSRVHSYITKPLTTEKIEKLLYL